MKTNGAFGRINTECVDAIIEIIIKYIGCINHSILTI